MRRIVARPRSAVLYNRCMHPDFSRKENQATFRTCASGVTVMQASFSDHTFERHSHDCFAIGVTTHGIQRYRCKGRQYGSQPGDFVLFNPDDDHDGTRGTADGFRYTIWYLPEEVVSASHRARNMARRARSIFPVRMSLTGRWLRHSSHCPRLSRRRLPKPCARNSLLSGFLGAMLDRHGERGKHAADSSGNASPSALAHVKDYIQAHYATDLSVAELAGVAGLSRAHLTRAFSAAYHMPPHVYLNTVRGGARPAADPVRHAADDGR